MSGKAFGCALVLMALCLQGIPLAVSEDSAAGFGIYDFVPPCPGERTFVQPDGTTFEGAVRGMEIGGGVSLADGHVAVMDSAGWWTYSASKEKGISQPSPARVGIDPAPEAGTGGGSDSVWLDSYGADSRENLFDAFGAGNKARAVVNYLVLMVDFQATGVDDRFRPGHDAAYFEAILTGNGTNPTGTLTEYYYENSYGTFTAQFDVVGPFRVSGAHKDYAPTNYLFMTRALQLADPTVNFAAYNYQFVIFIHAGPDQSATANPNHIWSFATDLSYATNDGVTIESGCCGPEINAQIGVFAHEMGHTLGCPDYYDTSYTTHGTGEWDVMGSSCWCGSPQGSNPGHFNPYSKQVTLGWVSPTVISVTTLGATLRQWEEYPDALRITASGAESFFFIYTNKTCARFDRYAHSSGLVIWHYDTNGAQSNRNRMRLAVEEWDYLDGTQEIRLALNRGEPTDPFQNDSTGMNGLTTPSTYLGTGAASGWTWCNISGCGATMKLDLLKPGTTRELSANFPKASGTPPLIESTSVTISSEIFNTGSTSASNVKVKFFDGEPGNGGVQIGTNQTIATLAGNSKATASVSWLAQPTGIHTVYVQVDPDKTITEADEGNNVQKSTIRVWPRNAPILMVDDDMNYEFQAAYEAALTALGYPYVMVTGTASLALMQNYEILIWFTGGNRQSGALNAAEIANIKTYLGTGKNAWFLSHRLASALGDPGTTLPGVDPDFLGDYLGAIYNRTYYAYNSWANGTGDEIGGTNSFQLSIPLGRAFSDSMGVNTSATSSMSSSYEKQYAVKKDNGTWKTVFFGFDLSQVVSVSDRNLLTQRVLDWFRMSTVSLDKTAYDSESPVQVSVHDTDLSGTVSVLVKSGTEPAGETVICTQVSPGNFQGTVAISETDSAGVLHVTPGDRINATYTDASPSKVRYALADITEPVMSSYDVQVVAGWNLISIPLAPADGSVLAALADAGGDTIWTRAMAYDPTTPADPWKTYRVGGTANDLATISNMMGVWLWVTTVGDGLIKVSGSAPTSTAITLKSGWNLVGYPSTTSRLASVALAGTGADIVSVFQSATPYVQDIYNLASVTMQAGRGYWIHVPADTTWLVDW